MFETRTKTEYHVWILFLNPIRGRVEVKQPVAISNSKENLLKWYEDQLVELWTDDSYEIPDVWGNYKDWYKNFKKGSPLEWYNLREDNDVKDLWVTQEELNQISQKLITV